VRTLRKEYGDDFAKGYRSEAKIGTVMKKEKVDSLHEHAIAEFSCLARMAFHSAECRYLAV
jgi:hypothetical protein